MRVLIVGGSGFLGGELVRLCAARGHTVAATRFSTPPAASGAGPSLPGWAGCADRSARDAGGRPETGGPSPQTDAAGEHRETSEPNPQTHATGEHRETSEPNPQTHATGGSPETGGSGLRAVTAGGGPEARRPGPETVAAGGPGPGEWFRVDVRSRADVMGVIGGFRPDVTINAAYRTGDWAATADGAANVAAAVAAAGGRLVHVSSDAVFSGDAPSYDETCPPDPINPYGAAKAAAETAVRALVPEAAVVRTSLIVGHGASAHEAFVRSLATGAASGVLFTDDVRCPVHVSDLAAALLEIAERGLPGVHHVAGPQALSRYELGLLIARRDGLGEERLRPGLRAACGVRGPLEVRLDCSATRRRLRTRLRPASEFLTPPGS